MMCLKGLGLKFKQYWTVNPMLKLILFFMRKDVDVMVIIYATLIVKGKKTFTEVPDKIKEQVKEVLIDLDCGNLATE